MSRVVYNPPPGWESAPSGWVPPADWQPPPAWPSLPQGWPLFVTVRRGLRPSVQLVLLGVLVVAYVGVMAVLGRSVPPESLGLVGVALLAQLLASRVRDRYPTPVAQWPWRPIPAVTGYRGTIDHELGEELPWMRRGDAR